VATLARRPDRNGWTMTVLLDPGHGGPDPGAVWEEEDGTKVYESDIALDVVKQTVGHIAPHVRVLLSRTKDEFRDLRSRVITPRQYDLLVSVHCNAIDPHQYDVEAVAGTEVIVHSLRDEVLVSLARHFLYPVAKALGIEAHEPNPIRSNPRLRILTLAERIRDRHDRSTSCLRPATQGRAVAQGLGERSHGTPAMIIELGYLTNSRDRKALRSTRRRRAVAKAIGQCINLLAPKDLPA